MSRPLSFTLRAAQPAERYDAQNEASFRREVALLLAQLPGTLDGRYLQLSGGTLSGDLRVTGTNRTVGLDDGGAGSAVAVTFASWKGAAGEKTGYLSFGTDGRLYASAVELLVQGGLVLDRTGATGYAQFKENGVSAYFIQAGPAATSTLRFIRGDGITSDAWISSGVFGWGTDVRYSALAGEMVLQNNRALRAVNGATTDTIPLILLDAANGITVGAPVRVAGRTAAWHGSDVGSLAGGNGAGMLSATVPAGTSTVTVRAWGMLTTGIGPNDAYFEAQGAVVGGTITWRIIHDLDSTTGGGNQGFALSTSGLSFVVKMKSPMSYAQQGVARADYF